jgi:antitoxin component YwqK of YwqJK toxin-antitoxin module
MSYEEIKYSDGSTRKQWTNGNGEYHRESGPALAYYYPDGSIKGEYYHLDGVLHRELAPAAIWYYPDGSIEVESFYLNGECLGRDNKGFWAFWDRLTEDKRQNLELLKYLARFS